MTLVFHKVAFRPALEIPENNIKHVNKTPLSGFLSSNCPPSIVTRLLKQSLNYSYEYAVKNEGS